MKRTSLVALATIALLTPSAAFSAPTAQAANGDHVVISEAYLNGGSSGATYLNKYVELYNPTDSAVSLTGWSLQYRAYNSTSPASVANLAGTIPAKGYYLIQGNANSTNGADWKASLTPDAAPGTAWSGSSNGGQLILADTTEAQNPASGSVVSDADNIVDLFGYTKAYTFEGHVESGAGAVASAFARNNGADTDDNEADFSQITTFAPTNSAGVTYTAEPPAPPAEKTIAEIQGTTNTSPLAGVSVTTRGFVTARYNTGGFNGYVIQAAGSGTVLDDSSDALFVYSSATAASVAIGDYVQVTGKVSEYNGLTELTVNGGDLTKLDATGVSAPVAVQVSWPATDAGREALESMLIEPQGDFTVTDTYDTNYYGSVGLSAANSPLLIPTEVGRPGSAANTQAIADNAAQAVTLDDGASINFNSTANKSIPLTYLSLDKPVRVGAAVTFTAPVIVDYRNNLWNLQPTQQLTAANADTVQPATFANTRTPAPAAVGGRFKLASFNVLNYFTTTGADAVAAGATCTFYNDRDGNHITVNSCTDPGVRGAADAANLARQQAKIVAAINTIDADVVSLEEIENSTIAGKPRDAAVAALVDALNAAAGSTRWAFAPSPATVPAGEDVIRTAFIYNPNKIELIGESAISTDPAFDNARPSLAQAFQPVNEPSNKFLAIVNHFKSKGCPSPALDPTNPDADQGDGQGCWNDLRVQEAQALVSFAGTVATSVGTDRVFLTGDFNAYTQEDPMQVLYDAGYTDQGSKTGKYTYSFDSQSGSLDHILTSAAAEQAVTGADIWNINSGESLALEYSRYNYNITNLYDASPYRSSDHDPEIVGYNPALPATATTVKLSKTKVAYGTPITATAVVTGASTGTVRFTYANRSVDVPLVNGSASLTLPATLAVGRYQLVASFVATSSAAGSSSAPVKFIVTKAKVKVIGKTSFRIAGVKKPFTFVVRTEPLGTDVWASGTLKTYLHGHLVDTTVLTEADRGTTAITIDAKYLKWYGRGSSLTVITKLTNSKTTHNATVKWIRLYLV
ncbi:ExeM/NucH family extracellular endonuclease [Propionicimonas sp.]|uniref:ExeM/NucH family extracellular endonuclease n=1 Tax=Propionicimonas sp. TaxID=1955623 RepID=UPI001809EAE5|nr:ExeM/NucH family extracellular endonuclease [Propionicimonas sp.]MBU3976688.1 ExeM/NucH family extracellular endonuclease [Actinomycetota bacterium]MBA3019754.1 ExeM/NucH family extracellular endonuclease [Propionicimonas sp.]MBU3986783.1 ExeM/NucH family extracellular endonuclease [Actinomycetota bacterium]MBU4006695.1 ExeM/NucH family extracellular endonuclease [Actinomycetota bacterium]MBU4065395.1 ExeM/NucH family extracellular endonuclease [Actinomycetota bacterium]